MDIWTHQNISSSPGMEWDPLLLVWPEIQTKKNVNTSLSVNSVSLLQPIMFRLNLRVRQALLTECLGSCPLVIPYQPISGRWGNELTSVIIADLNPFYEITAQDKRGTLIEALQQESGKRKDFSGASLSYFPSPTSPLPIMFCPFN